MIGAIIQARISSARFPGKVLKPLCGQPMLIQQIARIERCRSLDYFWVATSVNADDDIIETICNAYGVPIRRGSLEDVLDRFYQIAKSEGLTVVIRLTADCPLVDPDLLDMMIERFLESGADYLSNCMPPTFPDGLDVEIMTFAALKTAWTKAVLPSHREHVTPFIRQPQNCFLVENFANDIDLSHLRWTVDERKDLEFVRKIYADLFYNNPEFTWRDVMELLRSKPHLAEINAGIKRNEGSLKSKLADKSFMRDIST